MALEIPSQVIDLATILTAANAHTDTSVAASNSNMAATMQTEVTARNAAIAAAGYTLPAATASALGGIFSGATFFDRTVSPISVAIAGIAVLGAGLLPSVSVTVPGVSAGDFVLAAFATGTAPASITLSAVQVTAANTVRVTPAATGALTLGSSNLSLHFLWIH